MPIDRTLSLPHPFFTHTITLKHGLPSRPIHLLSHSQHHSFSTLTHCLYITHVCAQVRSNTVCQVDCVDGGAHDRQSPGCRDAQRVDEKERDVEAQGDFRLNHLLHCSDSHAPFCTITALMFFFFFFFVCVWWDYVDRLDSLPPTVDASSYAAGSLVASHTHNHTGAYERACALQTSLDLPLCSSAGVEMLTRSFHQLLFLLTVHH
jgi:hypothetical protein